MVIVVINPPHEFNFINKMKGKWREVKDLQNMSLSCIVAVASHKSMHLIKLTEPHTYNG